MAGTELGSAELGVEVAGKAEVELDVALKAALSGPECTRTGRTRAGGLLSDLPPGSGGVGGRMLLRPSE